MTPKDWDKIEKLLGPMADQETVEAVKALVEGIETSLKGSLTANAVKSVQRGVICMDDSTTKVTATINAVDTNKTVLILCGSMTFGLYGGSKARINLSLTNETTITAERKSKDETSFVSYQVLEYH